MVVALSSVAVAVGETPSLASTAALGASNSARLTLGSKGTARSELLHAAGTGSAEPQRTDHVHTHRRAESSSLIVKVLELPKGQPGSVSVSGPKGFHRRISRSTKFSPVIPGTYSVAVSRVKLAKATYYPEVQLCNPLRAKLCPALAKHRIRVARGKVETVFVAYNDVIPDTTIVLNQRDLGSVLRSKSTMSGSTIEIAGATGQAIAVGDVLASVPTKAFPYGLLRKVTSATRTAESTILKTKPATLYEALTRGSVDLEKADPPARVVEGSLAPRKGLALSPQDTNYSFDLGDTPFSCEGSSGVSASASANVSPPVVTFAASWGLGGPSVSLTAELSASTQVTVDASQGLDCSASFPVPAAPDDPGYSLDPLIFYIGIVPVVIVPEFTGEVSVSGSIQGDVTASAGASIDVTVGASYQNGTITPIEQITHSFTYNAPTLATSGGLTAEFGPKVYLDLYGNRALACLAGNCGDGVAPYVELLGGADLTAQLLPPIDPWWQLDGVLDLGIGLQIPEFDLDLSQDFRLVDDPLAAAPGRPTNVAATPEDGSAVVSWQPPPSETCAYQTIFGNGSSPCGVPTSGFTVLLNNSPVATTNGATSVTLTGLTNGNVYQVEVRSNSVLGPGGTSSPVSVTPGSPSAAPTVTNVSPNSGPTAGSTSVTITGTNFSTGSGTSFDFGSDNPAMGVNCSSSTTCTATTPAQSTGTVDVIAVVDGDSSSANPPGDQFTYGLGPLPIPPPVTSVSECPGSASGAGTITLTSGTGSFSSVGATNKTITVSPGTTLSGDLSYTTSNIGSTDDVAPLIWTPTWGDNSTDYTTVSSWIGIGTSNFTTPISITIPSSPGTYYLIFAFALEIGADHVASATNWATGEDIWDKAMSHLTNRVGERMM